jgi:hypothetical protein
MNKIKVKIKILDKSLDRIMIGGKTFYYLMEDTTKIKEEDLQGLLDLQNAGLLDIVNDNEYLELQKSVNEVSSQIINATNSINTLSSDMAALTNDMGDGKLAKQNSNRYTKPLFVDGVTSFNFTGQGVPAGITNYTGGNYYLTISGNIGDSYLTVLGGNIAHAGTSQKWAAVVKDDYENWKP